jgi:hypothetical protein
MRATKEFFCHLNLSPYSGDQVNTLTNTNQSGMSRHVWFVSTAKKKGHNVDVCWHFSLCSFDGKNGKKLSQDSCKFKATQIRRECQDSCKFKITQIRRECQATLALARISARTTMSRNQGFIRNFIPSTTHQKKVWRVKSKG